MGVTSCWALMSSTHLYAHDIFYIGLDLPGIIVTDGISNNNDVYMGDVDTYAGAMENDIHAVDNVMTRLATGTQIWANLCNVIAQSIAFHKYIVQILSYTNVKSSLRIDTTRKTSSWFGNAYDARAAYVGTLRSRTALAVEDVMMPSPTAGKWFQRQAKEMKLRIGILRFQNEALTFQMVRVDSMIKDELLMTTRYDN